MAGEFGDLTQTAVVAGGGGLTLIGVITWFLKMLREQRAANSVERTAGTVEAGTTFLFEHTNREVLRLTNEVVGLVADNKLLQAAERTTAILNAELTTTITGLKAEIEDLQEDLRIEKEASRALEVRLSALEGRAYRPEMSSPTGLTRRASDAVPAESKEG